MRTQNNEKLQPGHFFCPKCFDQTQYAIKPVSVRTHFYYINLFPTYNLNYVVECKVRKRGFDPHVLDLEGQVLVRLSMAVRTQMRKGLSKEQLRIELVDAGFGEVAEDLISLATV